MGLNMRIIKNNFISASLNFFSNFKANFFVLIGVLLPLVTLSCSIIFLESYTNNNYKILNDFKDNELLVSSQHSHFAYRDYIYNNDKNRKDFTIIPFIYDDEVSSLLLNGNYHKSLPTKVIASSLDMEYSGVPILNETYPTIDKIDIIHGRYWTKEEEIKKEKVIIINKTSAMLYFGKTDCTGYELYVGRFNSIQSADRYKIIGVVSDDMNIIQQIRTYNQSKTKDTDLIPTINIYMPISTYFNNFTDYYNINTFIISRNGHLDNNTPGYLKGYLKTTYNGDFEVYSKSLLINKINNSNEKLLFYLQIPLYLVITLTYLGVTNSTISMINSRKVEIGIRKSYGASKLDIILLFLMEILSLLFVAATIAIMLSYIIVGIGLTFLNIKITVSIFTILKIYFIAISPGIIFTIVPIILISKKDVVYLFKN